MWDSIRYYLALVMVMTAMPALLYWFVVHPFVEFWRRVGVRWTFVALTALLVGGAAALFSLRHWLLAVEYGFNPLLTGLGAALYILSTLLAVPLRKKLKFRILVGVPEIETTEVPQGLLADGIYSRIRHPRYVQVAVGFLAVALLTNYLATYLLSLVTFPVLYFIVVLEERELRARFGSEYEEYCRRVPRFIPHW